MHINMRIKPILDLNYKPLMDCSVYFLFYPLPCFCAKPEPWQQSGMKWVVHCIRQVWGAFLHRRLISYCLPHSQSSFWIMLVWLSIPIITIWKCWRFFFPPLCKCQNAIEVSDNSGMQMCFWCFLGLWLRALFLRWCESWGIKAYSPFSLLFFCLLPDKYSTRWLLILFLFLRADGRGNKARLFVLGVWCEV